MTDLSLFGVRPQVPAWAGKLVAFLSAAYPAWKPLPESIAVYYSVLHDLEPQDIEAGVREYVSVDHQYAPSAGQVRAAAIRARKSRLPHGSACDCMDCVSRLPIADRWHRLAPGVRDQIERENPEGARKLREAAGRALADGLDQAMRRKEERDMKGFQKLAVLVVVLGLLAGTCGSSLAKKGAFRRPSFEAMQAESGGAHGARHGPAFHAALIRFYSTQR